MEILREACHRPCPLLPLTLMPDTQIRLLEQLRHPNIVSYHHAWIEPTRFSSFGPRVPTLQCVRPPARPRPHGRADTPHSVLMQWAEAGSLDDFLAARLGHARAGGPASQPGTDDTPDTRSARIRAFRAAQTGAQPVHSDERAWRAVHLLGADEIHSLLQDVVEGLAFLVGDHCRPDARANLKCYQHDKSILHLDLKPGNILLTADTGRLMYAPAPRSALACMH
jgi:serine/threonine protein kinase